MTENRDGTPEQREHARAPIELKVDYKKRNSFFADYTKNISKGGTFIKTRRALPIGTRFLFRLTVPGRADPFELSCWAERAWVRGRELAMNSRQTQLRDRYMDLSKFAE